MKLSVFYEHILEAATQENCDVIEIAKKVKSFGISAVEIEDKRLYENQEEVLTVLRESGLSISCIYGFFDFSHQGTFYDGKQMVDLAASLSVEKIMLIPGFLTRIEFLPFIYHKKLDKIISVLKHVCEYAKEKKIMLVLEDFDGKEAPFATSKQLKYFLDQIPDLYCAFDTGNFLFSEEDAYQVLPIFLDRIKHVHCKDRTFLEKEQEIPKETIKGRKMYSCAVGSGCIPMKEILDKIISKNYQGMLAIEHFGSLCQLSDMENSAKWLKEHVQIDSEKVEENFYDKSYGLE